MAVLMVSKMAERKVGRSVEMKGGTKVVKTVGSRAESLAALKEASMAVKTASHWAAKKAVLMADSRAESTVSMTAAQKAAWRVVRKGWQTAGC